MFKGIVFALSACMVWGLIFIIPQIFMENFSALEIALGRFWCYGTISLLLLLKARLSGFCRYPLAIWLHAIFLSFLTGYYLWVVLAMRYTSPAICALILGISPITIAFYGNWMERSGHFRQLLLPSVLILIGLIMINAPQITLSNSLGEYAIGLVCSLYSLLSWSFYVVLNARFLKRNSQIDSNDWATLLGVATLLWAIIGSVVCLLLFWNEFDVHKYFSANNDTLNFYVGCGLLGLLCSWLGAFLWNKASLSLPVSLAGQLMIFETIFGLLFVYLLQIQIPPVWECAGILLLLGAVWYGIRTLSLHPA